MSPDLLHWAASLPVSLPVSVPTTSDAAPGRLRLTADILPAPAELSTGHLRFDPATRSPGSGAVSIELLVFTAERRTFRALGLALLGHALSEPRSPLRIRLADGARQVVVWPGAESPLDRRLGIRRRVTEAHYRPALPEGTPRYTTTEQDDEGFPREHLPYARLGTVDGIGITRPGQSVCAHLAGTAPSLVWLGKYLLNLALEDNPAVRGYLYNLTPAESLAPGSAEMRFEVAPEPDGAAEQPSEDDARPETR